MRPIRYYIVQVGDHWEVSCTWRGQPTTRHADRDGAREAAEAVAEAQWRQQQVASEVMLSEDDGAWHRVASYGSLL